MHLDSYPLEQIAAKVGTPFYLYDATILRAALDRLVVMAEGEILAEGTPEEMKQRYRSSPAAEPTMEEAFIALIEGYREA